MYWRMLLLALLLSSPALAQERYWQIDIKGAIGPGISDYLVTELNQAQSEQPALVLLTMDTPGGLYSATRDIISAMLESSVPVVVYVSPGGARAASAGTYILYASHVAAMAPGTHLGAATPVQMMPTGTPAPGDTDQDEQQDNGPSSPGGGAMERKSLNDAIAYLRSLAQLRGRNVEWAEQAVRDAATLTATEALEQNVIDLVAGDIPELLQQLDGRRIPLHNGSVTLATAGLLAEPRQPDWRQQFIIIISNPNIAYLLMLVGVYGLLLEFYSPGFGVSGVIGAICLLLAMLSLQMLPFNTVGLGLLALGLALMVAEGLSPSFGILGGGGLVAFVLGSVLLFDTPDAAFRVAWPFIAAFTVFSLSLILVVVRLIVKQRRAAPVSGADAMVGEQGITLTALDPDGTVLVQGERWQAHSHTAVAAQRPVIVVAVRDLVLDVEPTKEDQA
ncbi:membrane-bound serine protease (ClpP class)-like protein [Oceanimonas sp. GK1]|uniref:NfeD family protein n=1 Tax=Oceanimonas sp. (strain GK1 / IBRC-M 10197) TaxID=511062 RepID=UPI0002495408|nr:nodulation protein NfeD [Oceanimonas sp. GK1]AEY01014.1 membrane-bound serine protease (ClpP class)-like protein [Oceanimonas sp. GK1]